MLPAATTTYKGDPAAQLAAEPEHDYQPGRDRRVVCHLRGRDNPEHAAEPAPGEGTAGRHQHTQHHRAQDHRERGQMAADEQQVASTPPRRKQPERGNELGQPEGPVHRTEMLRLQARDERLYDEQADQAEKHVRAHDDPAIHGQRHYQRYRQGALRDGSCPPPTGSCTTVP